MAGATEEARHGIAQIRRADRARGRLQCRADRLDIYPTSSWDDDALVHPESRAPYRKLVGRSWTDALRHLHPKERVYTFWHYKRMRWQRDAGLRLDHLLLSRDLGDRLVEAGVDRDVRGREDASDYAPVWITLRDG